MREISWRKRERIYFLNELLGNVSQLVDIGSSEKEP
jgi:hypothetical protein